MNFTTLKTGIREKAVKQIILSVKKKKKKNFFRETTLVTFGILELINRINKKQSYQSLCINFTF